MPTSITINDKEVQILLDILKAFQDSGVSKPAEVGAKKLKDRLKTSIQRGSDPSNHQYPHVQGVTQEMEIARSGPFTDSRIRGEVSNNPIAMNVTGKTADSLFHAKKSDKEFEVGYEGARADVVFQSNAKGKGNAKKPKRDPLGLSLNLPTTVEFDIVADEIEEKINELLNGF